MAVLDIRIVPDPVLRKKGVRISPDQIKGRAIQQLIDDMLETMRDAGGVGLAAPQVGQSLRLVVIEFGLTEMGEEGDDPVVLINPEIVRCQGHRRIEEGCLSVPGYKGMIDRCEKVTAKGLDRRGKEVKFKATEMFAQALEHEIDHTNGILYLDHLKAHEDLIKLPENERVTEAGSDQPVLTLR
ncbi:MAG: peptide deformylase [Chloroflexi bacterium]|nr:peptide deformylase [Chloroflexota bacterium]